jgi:hypothetical protein
MTMIAPTSSTNESISSQYRELATLINRHTADRGASFHQTDVDKLQFGRESVVVTSLAGASTPMLALVVQGKKASLLGEETYHYGAAQYLAISVDLPLSGYIIEATPAQPYLGFKLDLDPHQLCDIITQTRAIDSIKILRSEASL